ncbi:MAG TPA: hypothetical protein DDY70_00575, partial [Clostridiales bacterium]|nr:hypothetical protein [Clostridiales bacterium]
TLAADMKNPTNDVSFRLSDENNYKDYELEKGQWVYFKEVLLVIYDRSFVGLGLGRFDGESVNVSYLNAYRNSYERETFTSDYFYPRVYRYAYSETSGKQTPLDTNYKPWDDTKPIDLLFDDDDTNWIHSDRSDISEASPFELTADLGAVMKANRFTIYGEPTRQYQPKNFRLYGGTDLQNMELIAEVTDSVRENNNITVDFKTRDIRYYKLVVTDTWATGQRYRYLAFRTMKFSYSLDGGLWLSPDEEMFLYRGGWHLSSKLSAFGHLYEGENATLDFEFSGTRFALFSYFSADFDSFEVLVDGEVVTVVSLKSGENKTALAYLSDEFTDGTHHATVRSKTRFNIDSVVLWQTEDTDIVR